MIFLLHCASPEKSIPTPYTNSERARGLICKLVAVKNGEGGSSTKKPFVGVWHFLEQHISLLELKINSKS